MARSEGPTALVLTALAAYRVTRLVTKDSLLEEWRERLFDQYPPSADRARLRWNDELSMLVMRAPDAPRPTVSKVGQLLDCAWCTGFWVTGAAVLATRTTRPVLTTLALSTVVGMIGAVDGTLVS